MSMSNYANSTNVVEESFVEEIVKEELDALKEFLKKHNCSFEELAKEIQYDYVPALSITGSDGNTEPANSDALDNELIEMWKSLQTKFQEKTGLSLDIQYHDSEERGDEVNGFFWCVDGVYDYTEAGRKYKDNIQRKSWVTWG